MADPTRPGSKIFDLDPSLPYTKGNEAKTEVSKKTKSKEFVLMAYHIFSDLVPLQDCFLKNKSINSITE